MKRFNFAKFESRNELEVVSLIQMIYQSMNKMKMQFVSSSSNFKNRRYNILNRTKFLTSLEKKCCKNYWQNFSSLELLEPNGNRIPG
jgi:hypothetical protein